MQTLTVQLQKLSYPIYIGERILQNTSLLQPHITGKQVLIVSHPAIAERYVKQIMPHLINYQTDILLLPEGEQHKTLIQTEKIFTALLENHHHRNTTLIALGGGVIGDIAGFAAACYQRGVNYLQIPTTLLAQVDASIGGKTAVNHILGKNMVGAFHQPQCVIIDTATLNSLPQREFNAGLAEIIKAALINDAEFFAWLEINMPQLRNKEPAALMHAITQACIIKRDIVMQDEKETKGIRALLNLGHTFGHALEQMTNYKLYLHGEAVAIGIALAAQLSAQMAWLSAIDAQRINHLLQAAALPINLPKDIDEKKFLTALLRDKKIYNNHIILVLLKKIGAAKLAHTVPISTIEQLLKTRL